MPVQAEQLQAVDTLGGRMHVGWDAGAAATPHDQLVFFAEFLATTGVFEQPQGQSNHSNHRVRS